MTNNIRQAVIMVGGKGTRLRPLTNTVPKPALPVLNKPCLKYLMESLVEGGIKEIFLACGYKSEILTEAIGNGSDMGVSIEYSYEPEPLGTCGAIKLLEDRLDGHFMAANGDVFADIDVKGEIERHLSSNAKATLALTRVKNPCEFGIVDLDETGRVIRFLEKPKPEDAFSDLINAGVYCLDRSILDYAPKDAFFDLSKDMFPILMNHEERIQGFVIQGIWRDVGRPSDLLGVNQIMANKIYGDFTWSEKKTVNSEINRPFYLGEGSCVQSSKVNASVILNSCKVADSRITNSLILNGTTIESAQVDSSIIGNDCIISPGSRIVNAVIADGTIVGPGEAIEGDQVFK